VTSCRRAFSVGFCDLVGASSLRIRAAYKIALCVDHSREDIFRRLFLLRFCQLPSSPRDEEAEGKQERRTMDVGWLNTGCAFVHCTYATSGTEVSKQTAKQ